MDAQYQDCHKQAVNLEHKFRDVVDNSSHPDMEALRREIKNVIEDIESNKDPRAVEARVKNVQQQLSRARSQGEELLSFQDIEQLRQSYEKLRESLRRMPNY